jgi:hypothetical protein
VITVTVTLMVLAVAGAVIWLVARHSDRTPTPSLYTNANSIDVWVHPNSHLGARLEVQATLQNVTRLPGSVVATVGVDKHVIAVHVFDSHFQVANGTRLRIVGTVRGPLGGVDGLAGQAARTNLPAGTAVVDAEAVSSLNGTPVSAPTPAAHTTARHSATSATATQVPRAPSRAP